MTEEKTRQERFNEDYEGYQSSNAEFTTTSAIAERIEVEPILEKLSLQLEGCEVQPVRLQDGQWVMKKREVAEPLMNKQGHFMIMGKLRTLMTRANVQGNFEGTHYDEYMRRVHRNIANMITTNTPYWHIKSYNMKFVVDLIMDGIEPFFTRLKDDKERGHFDQQVRISENTRSEAPRRGFLHFGGG